MPELKPYLAHGGWVHFLGVARMDKVAGAMEPDALGVDRVVLGTDHPAPMVQHDAVNWVNSPPELSAVEKQAILSGNPARMLGLS